MSTTVIARTGRQRQRYDNHFRLVSGCIPYRLVRNVEKNSTCDLLDSLEVLMISSPNRHDLVFPKGGWEDDETVREAASREALEEAGVIGILNETMLGVWEFRSKSKQNNGSLEGGCRGFMFAMEVVEEMESWPEQDVHPRRWVTVRDAWRLCRYEWMREALVACVRLLSGTSPDMSPLPRTSEPSTMFCLMKSSGTELMDGAINAVLNLTAF